MKTDNLAAKIVNPARIACEKAENSVYWTTRVYGPRFKKLSADKGIGRFLLYINAHPGFTKKAILDGIFGDRPHAQFNETFCDMRHTDLIINKKGYYITDLGVALLKQFELL